MLPAVVDYGLQEGGDQAVPRFLNRGLEPFYVLQFQVSLFFKEFDQICYGLVKIRQD